jgi:hypothetical protein
MKKKKPQVFKGPGFRLKQQGRFIEIDTHRSAAEHKQIIDRIAGSRPKMAQEIERLTNELLALVHRFTSLELLAQLTFLNFVHDPNEYKEYSFEGRSGYVEHLAVLELKDRQYEIRSIESPDGKAIEAAQDLLKQIYQLTVWDYLAKSLDTKTYQPPEKLEQVRLHTMMNELFVRSPGYFHHWSETLQSLFGTTFVKAWMQEHMGFDIDCALKCIDAVETVTMGNLHKRREEGQKQFEKIAQALESFRNTGSADVDPEYADVFQRIANSQNPDEILNSLAVIWTFFSLHDTFSFTAQDLSESSGEPQEVIESFLQCFSLTFGSTPTEYLFPALISPLRSRPLIKYEERYFCPAPLLLIWALKPRIEESAKSVPASNPIFWDKYQKFRGTMLVTKALAYFQSIFPKGSIYEHLTYEQREQGEREYPDLDGLVLFDRYAFLIEAKAGEVRPSARRGAPKGMVEDLERLVVEPNMQALRAHRYIQSTPHPKFRLEDSSIVEINKTNVSQWFLVTLTLDDLTTFTRMLWELAEVGLFKEGELPWAISLMDLRIISETLSNPIQFVHYLKWRLALNERKDVRAASEIDWLGYYLHEGPKPLIAPEGFNFMQLETYTTAFDDYYLWELGQRTVPAVRPEQPFPPELKHLVNEVLRIGRLGCSIPGEMLLDLEFHERNRLATLIQQFRAGARTSDRSTISFNAQRALIVIRVRNAPSESLQTEARRLAHVKQKSTIIFEMNDARQLLTWGVAEIVRDKPSE